MKSFIVGSAVTLFLSVPTMAKPKMCSVGSTSGIELKFEKAVGTQILSPLSGPLENLIVGVSVAKVKGRDIKPIPNRFEQVDIFKKDHYSVRLALFTKEDFVTVDASNGELTSAKMLTQTLDQPFHLLTVQSGWPENSGRELWLQCD
jgi:hypothetical protein